MIRLGLRLAVAGGREAISRLALIAVAVAIGVGLLLTTLASLHAVTAQNSRYAWLETGYTGSDAPAVSRCQTAGAGSCSALTAGTGSALLWRLRADYFHGTRLGRVDLAGLGPDAPIPPGLPALPGPGQFYASPALATLIRETPRPQLADRFPGVPIGVIGKAALPAPNSLVIVIGHEASELAREPEVERVSRISQTVPSSCSGECAFGVGIDSSGLTLILAVVAAALLFPVLIFVGGATRLSAARREQRFAAMRLVGATPRQIALIATVESALGSAAGVLLGFGLFYAFRPVLARIPFTGDPFFTGDLALSWSVALVVAAGIPVASAVAARLALRRVNISPLGVARRVTPPPPGVWRVLPLVAGIAELTYLAYASDIGDSHRHSSGEQALAYLTGIFLVMGGLVIIGPWLTGYGSRGLARRATRPAALIAARRLADDPKASFRAISGLVLALFVGTCSLAIISTISAYRDGAAGPKSASTSTLVIGFEQSSAGRPASVPAPTTAALTAIGGVAGLAVIRLDPASAANVYPPTDYVECAQLARVPSLGRCPAGASVVRIQPVFGLGVIEHSTLADQQWPAAAVTAGQLSRMPVEDLVVGNDGSAAAVEQSRTVLDLAYPAAYPAQTIGEIAADGSGQLDDYRRLAEVVILASLPIAGCSLAVAIAGGLSERRRPFSLLRLTGARLALLRRVITLEAATPLLISAALSIAAGLVSAHLFLRAQLHETLQPPGLSYYLVVALGLAGSLAVIASTMPLVRRVSRPEVARND